MTLTHEESSNYSLCPANDTYLSDVPKSINVWHRGGFIRTHNDFPCLLVDLHTELVKAQNFGFRGSA